MAKWITDTTGVAESAVNIGLIQHQGDLYLVDTGIDNSAVNKVRKSLDMKVKGALVTHHHADHMGGCSKLENLGVTELYGPGGELPLIHQTVLEPATMFGGSTPPELLRNRHLEARPAVSVSATTEQSIVKVVECPGHTFHHQSFIYGDTIYTGDSAFTSETIEKYKILFAVDPLQAAESVDKLIGEEFSLMIPGHGPIQESRSDALEVLRVTKEHYTDTAAKILSAIGEKLPYDTYINTMIQRFGLSDIVKDRGFLQYILYQVPLKGYLSNFLDEGKVSIETTDTGPMIIAT